MPRPRRFLRLKLRQKTLRTISALIFFFGFLFLFILNFVSSPYLIPAKEILNKIFGFFLAPFALLGVYSSLFFFRLKTKLLRSNYVFGLLIILFALAALSNFFTQNLAGLLGEILWQGVAQVLTAAGAFLVLLALFSIGVIVFVNAPLDQALILLGASFLFVLKLGRSFFNLVKPKVAKIGQPKTIEFKMSSESVGSRKEGKSTDEAPSPVGVTIPTMGKIWQYPPLSLLSDGRGSPAQRGDVKTNAATIEKTLESFGIRAKVVEINPGPTVTQFALEIPLGTRLSKITSLTNDLALNLAAPTGQVRIEAPIPGKSLVGIEIPNIASELVTLKSVLASQTMRSQKSKLAVVLGLDVSGDPVVADIAKMPHVLIAGATGSGKSVLLNAFIASLLFRNSPYELKLLLVDPKRVELAHYHGIPHLLTPVIVDLEKILSSLKWILAEMTRRYKLFEQAGVRNIQEYNELSGFQALPNLVAIIDELAELMKFAPVEVEDAINRIAATARATGIHLVVATQSPRVDVITGLIKANITCRIAFNVASMIDSRVIIDQPGAEKLLGRGDMLYVPPDISKPQRIQGVYVSDEEIRRLIDFIKSQGVEPEYASEVTEMPFVTRKSQEVTDDLFEEAVRTVCQYDRASASLLQRRLRIGYARAARLLDQLENAGIVGPGEGAKPRDVLVRNAEEFLAQKAANL